MSGRLGTYLADPVALILEALVLPTGQAYSHSVQPWQRAFFEAVFRRHDDGRPLHRLVYSERRRGESKTEDVAACALTDLLTGPPRHRSYAVAADEDQARLILDAVGGFLARSPVLADLAVQRNVVRNLAIGAELRVLAADAPTAYGIRPRRVFFDELSLQPDERLWLAMWSAIGKDPRAQMVAVSMAGFDFASVSWKVRELAAGNPAYYFHSREGSELAPWLSEADVEEQRATLHPMDFARLWECRWMEPAGAWITREMYDGCVVLPGPASRVPEAVQCVGFVDVGLVHDATAVAVCHGDGDRVVLDVLRTLRGTRNEPVELEVLEDLVIELTRDFRVRRWVFEAPQAVASVQRLGRLLGRVRVDARYPTVDTQARLFGTLYRLFASRRLALFPHEELRREALALLIRQVGGRLKVVESSAVHQDHVIAVGGAAALLEHRQAGPTGWRPTELSNSRRRGGIGPWQGAGELADTGWPE